MDLRFTANYLPETGKNRISMKYYNDITNIAAGAIVAGSFSDSGEKKLYVPENITITDNVIDGIGKSYLGGVLNLLTSQPKLVEYEESDIPACFMSEN